MEIMSWNSSPNYPIPRLASSSDDDDDDESLPNFIKIKGTNPQGEREEQKREDQYDFSKPMLAVGFRDLDECNKRS